MRIVAHDAQQSEAALVEARKAVLLADIVEAAKAALDRIPDLAGQERFARETQLRSYTYEPRAES